MKRRTFIYGLVALLLVLATAAQVMAGTGSVKPANEREFTGIVTAVTPTTVTIGTLTFDISAAQMHDVILVGDVIKVHYSIATDGTLTAREVELFAITPEATDDFGLDGTQEAFDDHGHDGLSGNVEDGHHGTSEIGDDHGGDRVTPQAQQTPQQDDHGGHHDDGGGHGGHGGHGGDD